LHEHSHRRQYRRGYRRMMDPTARFTELVRRADDDIPLDEAALLIAAHGRPGVDVAAGLAALDEVAAGCGAHTFAGWRARLFDELGFTGNDRDYYEPANSFLDVVLERRTGIPITLAVVGIEVGRRIGVPLAGVGMPGHFLVRHDGDGDPVFVDAFSGGRLLDEAGCEALFRSHQPAGAAFDPAYLDPVRPRAIVERMLANLRAVYAARRDPDGLT